jgi:hypothetical protein
MIRGDEKIQSWDRNVIKDNENRKWSTGGCAMLGKGGG